ncbi:MAG: DNA translocase FtsK 4TM domain-containing protein [Bacteroidota bacterium]|nr:DNA translocase FtsK 4TM domain-containing protein [Bacteroidota bacterium]
MADKSRNTQSSSSRKTQSTSERRRTIITIISFVAGLVMVLSILSYSTDDEALLDQLTFIDIFRLPFNEHIRVVASELHNRLGLFGALVADFFVNSTVGYSSLMIPTLLILWAWFIFRKKEFQKLITFTNYSIVFILLISTTFGIINLIITDVNKEWSGVVGAFLADIAIGILGQVGAPIVILTALFITIVLAIDLDIHKSIDRIKSIWDTIYQKFARSESTTFPSEFETESDVMIHKSDEDMPPSPVIEEETSLIETEDEYEEIQAEQNTEELTTSVEEQLLIPEVAAKAVPDRNDDGEIDYVFPSIDLLDVHRQTDTIPDEELKANAELVRAKLANFGIEIENVSVTPGPVVTLYELVPASTVKISRIVSLADDLALALAAKGIRIMAPIPGKSAVGVEIPNKNPSLVSLRSVLNSTKFRDMKANLPIALGKNISGEVYTDDLAKMPHLLIAGSTGSGKSVGINTIIASLLFRLHPSEIKFVIIDPKKIELALYAKLNRHFLAVSPDVSEDIITTSNNAVYVLKGVELEMEKRYDRLAAAGVRNLQDYNERLKTGRLKDTETVIHRPMPYLIVVIDELADLMLTAAKEVEEPIARLAQLARAVGVHLVLATQRPSVDVITGVIKANFPARIAFQVATKIDSRTILDMNGAEQLLGNGDMLYLPAGSPKPIRIQNAFISTEEVERLTDHIARQQGYNKPFQLPSITEKKKSGLHGASGSRDEFFEEAAHLIVRHQQGSVSLIQRRLKVGYSRAARLIDELELEGIVGPFDGSKAREVLVENEEQLNNILKNL